MNGASASQLPGGEGPCKVAPGVLSNVVQNPYLSLENHKHSGAQSGHEKQTSGGQGWADVTCEWNISPCQACVNADGLTQAKNSKHARGCLASRCVKHQTPGRACKTAGKGCRERQLPEKATNHVGPSRTTRQRAGISERTLIFVCQQTRANIETFNAPH